jgi:hypothetical protein
VTTSESPLLYVFEVFEILFASGINHLCREYVQVNVHTDHNIFFATVNGTRYYRICTMTDRLRPPCPWLPNTSALSPKLILYRDLVFPEIPDVYTKQLLMTVLDGNELA